MIDLNLSVKPFLVLAPMDDVTDTVFRQIVADNAKPDLFMTEFVNVDGLQSPGRSKLLHKLAFSAKEKPIIAQIWGKKPENFYKTTKELKTMGFDGVDINMGCPVKAVIKNGCCIALANNRQLASEIIKSVQKAAGKNFPVSIKTRLGLNEVDLSWLEFLLKHKLNMLTIHGRTAKQLSNLPANWQLIGQVRELRDKLSPSTLIVGNGDVVTCAQAEQLTHKYQLDGIMIGRGVFDDPFVFSTNSPWLDYTKTQKIALYKKHIKLFTKMYKHHERRIQTLNKFCKIYINGFDDAKDLREQLMKLDSASALISKLEQELQLAASSQSTASK